MTPPTPTPNQLPTVLGVGSSAIEAAARALCGTPFPDTWEKLGADIHALYRHEAEDCLSAAAPFIAAQAKAEALGKLADDFDELASRASYGASEDVMETWLEAATRTRATIEGTTP